MRIPLFCALTLAGATALAAPPAPLARYDAGSAGSFIDDPFALRDDGKAVAFLTTDGATGATLHLADVGGTDVKIAGAPVDAVAVLWLSPARVLIVSGPSGASVAQVFTPNGPEKRKLGPFGALALATVDGRAAAVTYTRTEKRTVEHALVAYAADTLRPFKRRTWREDAEGQLKQGRSSVKPLWWSGGFTALAALRAGEYDKARDMRRPDRYTELDAFSGKVLSEKEIGDVLAFTRVSLLRRDAPNRAVIAHFSEDRKQLLMVDGIDQYAVALPHELWKYDPKSLAWHALDAHRIALSLTIDPVNPQAVARKKADVDYIDLYAIDRQTHAPTPLLRLEGEGRRSAWQAAGGRLLLLRKNKGFDRGGVALELYDLIEPRTAKH